jgi:predicted nuclease of predicted toxin-antitoxin system
MKIIADENVSLGVVTFLRNEGFEVSGIMESSISGLDDFNIFELVRKEKGILITREHHFTNSLRFPSEKTAGIIYIRKGNLTTQEEII